MSESAVDISGLSDLPERTQLVHHIVETVAEAEDADPLELEPLAHVVDMEALDVLFGPQSAVDAVPQPTSEVRFEYHGYEVCVSAIGRVSLTEL